MPRGFQRGAANPQYRPPRQPSERGEHPIPAVEVGEPPPGGSRVAGKRTCDDVGVRCAADNCDRVVADADGTPVPGEGVVRLLLVSLYFV